MRIVLLLVVVCLAGAAGVGWRAATETGGVDDPEPVGAHRSATPAVPWHHVEPPLQQPASKLRRADLPLGHAMPAHGVYVATMGMGSVDAFTVDFDRGTIARDYVGLYGNEPRGSLVKPLTASDLASVRRATTVTWNDPPYQPTHGAMDVDQIVAITDDDDAFFRTDSLLAGTHTGTGALLELVDGIGTATFGPVPR